MTRPRMTEAEEIARTVELRALYETERCIARGCTERGPFGINGRHFCQAHLPAGHRCAIRPTDKAQPEPRVAPPPERLL